MLDRVQEDNSTTQVNFWKDEKRHEITQFIMKHPDHKLNESRRLAVESTGWEAHLTADVDVSAKTAPVATVPVLLIRQGIQVHDDYRVNGLPQGARVLQTGWDLVLPEAWARPFFMALTFAGAVALGMDERNALQSEAGASH